MSDVEKFWAGIAALILVGIFGWLMATVFVNTGRISVLEQQMIDSKQERRDIKEMLREHRLNTEPRN